MSTATTRWRSALGHDFRVHCADADVLAAVDEALEALPGAPGGGTEYALVRGDAARPDERWLLTEDGEVVWRASSPARLLSLLLGRLNRAVVRDSADEHLLLHAAAAERDGHAVVLAAPMESGKTTTVAGLVRAGWGYYTDEAVAVRLVDGVLVPYAKPLSVDPGSWSVLGDLGPARASGFTDQWQVPVTRVPGGRVAAPLRVAAVVLPRYRRGAATVLTPLERSEALVTVLGCTFGLAGAPETLIGAAAAVVSGAQCWALEIGDLDVAVARLEEVAASARPPTEPWTPSAVVLPSGVVAVVVDGRAVCWEPGSGVLHRLDAQATAAWFLLRGGADLRGASAELAARTGAEPHDVARDLADLVPVLVRRGLLP